MMRVDFAETLEERLETIQEFLLVQDVSSAAGRMETLMSEIYRFGDLVAIHPKLADQRTYLPRIRSRARAGWDACCGWPVMQTCLNCGNTSFAPI
jgi:hypothetical protein